MKKFFKFLILIILFALVALFAIEHFTTEEVPTGGEIIEDEPQEDKLAVVIEDKHFVLFYWESTTING